MYLIGKRSSFMKYICIIIFFACFLTQAQTLQGFVSNEGGLAAPRANVLIKSIEEENLILTFSQTNKEGIYNISLGEIIEENNLSQVLVEVTKLGYSSQKIILKIDSDTSNYTLDFILPESTVELKPIVVKAKARRLKEKNDTVTYNPDSYKDGSERTVEDLLKKLPGIDIDGRGKIKFKGKTVEKVLLEGDDLFDYNYTVGTKNISVDIVDKVQAIEKWSENPLLKGIEDTDKVALNLKLKKGKVDFSGNGHAGYGYQDRYQFGVNGLAISKRHKNFTTIAHNNTGTNSSPYDYFAFNMSPDEFKNRNYKSAKLIPEQKFYSSIDAERATINNNWFGSGNHIIKFSKKLTAKINFNCHKDDLIFEKQQLSNYIFENGETLNTSNIENIEKSPTLYDGSVDLTWNSSKKSLTEFTSKWSDESIITNKSLISNSINNISSLLGSKSYFTKQELVHTLRLNKKNAIQLKGVYANNKNVQSFGLQPSLDFENDLVLTNGNTTQQVNNKKQNLILEGAYMGVDKFENKFQIDANLKFTKDNVVSRLFSNDELMPEDFQNNIGFNTIQTQVGGFYKLKWSGFVIRPQVDVKNYFIRYKENISNKEMKRNKFVLSPTLNLLYKLGRTSQLYMTHRYDESPQNINNLYNGYVLTTFRNLKRNEANLSFQKKYIASTGYSLNDLYNQFRLNFGVSYSNVKNNFFTSNIVGLNLNRTHYFILPEKNDSYSFNFRIEKYLPFLTSTVRLSSDYSISHYKNIVNNSTLRDNQGKILFSELFYKTAFDIPVNFENILRVNNVNSKSQNGDVFKNSSIVNSSRIVFKPNKEWLTTVDFDYFQPSTNTSTAYFFLDASVRYRTKDKRWEFLLTGKNLTGNKVFREISVSDFGKFESTQSLNQRYVLLTVNFQF